MLASRFWTSGLFLISALILFYFSFVTDPDLDEISFFEETLFYAGAVFFPLLATLTLFFAVGPRFIRAQKNVPTKKSNDFYLFFVWGFALSSGACLSFLQSMHGV